MISIEVFPPKSEEKMDSLVSEVKELMDKNLVDRVFVSETSDVELTKKMVSKFYPYYVADIVPHITVMRNKFRDYKKLLAHYAKLGVNGVLVLSGDIEMRKRRFLGPTWEKSLKYIRYACKKDFYVFVACYPAVHPRFKSKFFLREGYEDEVSLYMKRLITGAGDGITQVFFDKRLYDYLCDLISKKLPVYCFPIPGVMPPYLDMDHVVRVCKKSNIEGYSNYETMTIKKFYAPLLRAKGSLHIFTLNDLSCLESFIRSVKCQAERM